MPGTPSGAVGERRVIISEAGDGRLTVVMTERIDMEPGRRIVNRGLFAGRLTGCSVMTTTVEPLGPDSCEVTYAVAGSLPASVAEPSVERRLQRIAALATGQEPPAPPAPLPVAVSRSSTRRARRRTSGPIFASPEDVWAALRPHAGAPFEGGRGRRRRRPRRRAGQCG